MVDLVEREPELETLEDATLQEDCTEGTESPLELLRGVGADAKERADRPLPSAAELVAEPSLSSSEFLRVSFIADGILVRRRRPAVDGWDSVCKMESSSSELVRFGGFDIALYPLNLATMHVSACNAGQRTCQ